MIRLSAFADEISQDPAEQVECLRRNGIAFIEFRAILGKNVLDLSEAEHREFRALLEGEGFGLSAIASPIGKIPIGEDFAPHLARFRHALDLAEFYKAPNVRIFSYYLPGERDPGIYRDEVMRRMAAKAELAAERGLRLVLENEKGIYGDTAVRVADILTTVDSPALGHAFDPANYLEVGEDVGAAWEHLRDRVVHFHVKDYSLQTHRNVPAGEGDGRIPELIADAVSRGFAGFCVLEPHLVVAEKSFGFSGPDRFADAARALRAGLDGRQIAYT
jgi:sugar phosphate isomerase/epimerase